MMGTEIERLIQMLARLPGLGPRSGRRVALALLDKRESLLNPLISALENAERSVIVCGACEISTQVTHAVCVLAPSAMIASCAW